MHNVYLDTMDAQIENHLPLITSRLVFAPKVYQSPPTITLRMEFPSIHIDARDDSPVPENGGHQHRTGTPMRASTPRATPRRASTPKATPKRASTPKATTKRASTPRASAVARRPPQHIKTAVTFDENMDLDSLSPLTDDEDTEGLEKIGASEAEDEGDGDVNEGLILKPKGEVGRPGLGGYNLIKALDWSQKMYESVYVSKCGIYARICISPFTRRL